MKEDIRLIKPTERLENEYLDMILEWKQSGEELIPWSLNLETTDFKRLVEDLNDFSEGTGLADHFVEFSTYWLVDDSDRILGVIEIRHRLNAALLFRGGHIGYGIRPTERRKGYAGKMLALGLKQARMIGIPRVLITCWKDNIGSIKTIIKNRGVLDFEDTDNGVAFHRYWINLE